MPASPSCTSAGTPAAPTSSNCTGRSPTAATAAATPPSTPTWPPFKGLTCTPPAVPAPPKVRHITSWILRDPATLDDDEQASLTSVRARCPHLDALASHVTGFAKILTGRHGGQLDAWIAAVLADDQPHLHSFTTGLKRDYQAVLNGLTLPYSSGKVEGNVTRIKMLKRQMYGCAGFGLLRKRVLVAT